MDPIARVVRHVVAPLWARWERSPYLRHARRLRQTQYAPREVIEHRQWQSLAAIIGHAYDTSPFWRARFDGIRADAQAIQSADDFRRVPLLTKADLRTHGARLRSSEYRDALLHHKRTSGSTGVSVEVVVDDAAQQFKRACTLRSDEWSGWRLGERIASVWGNPKIRTDWKGRLRNLLLERYYLRLDTLNMDEDSMGAFVDGLLRKPTSLLFGHAHSLYVLASFIAAKRPDAAVRPRGIIATAMVLHDFERRKIEQVFGCRVTNRYGCEEVGLIACECERHEGLHVNADGLYVEIIDDGGDPCPPGVPGRLIVTDLVNRAMPIIRYEVGDMAAWAVRPCSCGRTLPLLAKVEGRVADYVVTRRGEYISGISLTENFAIQVPGVAQMQIVQEELDRFVFNIVRDKDFSEASLRRIAELTAERFGDDARYECNYLDRIPQAPSGKFRFCISKVEKSFA